MALELHIAGPGLDVARRLSQGDEELVLGRDPECDVCLPDPERTVSRRHLSLWVENDQLHFHVLSVVNGIEMPFGEAPPGARGVLPKGQALKVGDYSVDASVLAPEQRAPSRPIDPWAVFDRDGSGTGAATQPAASTGAHTHDEDPFGDWGFESSFAADAQAMAASEARSHEPADAQAFFRGLGLGAGGGEAMTQGELEAIGALVRVLVLGVLDLHESVVGVKEDLRAEDRTMMAPRDRNPLKSSWSHDTKIRYLFGGRLAAAGLSKPERAVREMLVDLVAHNAASAAATRSAVESILREFAPPALKERLLGTGSKLFGGSRAWDAYSKYHDEQGADMAGWSQRLLDKYFTEAYLRESMRIRRETPPRGR